MKLTTCLLSLAEVKNVWSCTSIIPISFQDVMFDLAQGQFNVCFYVFLLSKMLFSRKLTTFWSDIAFFFKFKCLLVRNTVFGVSCEMTCENMCSAACKVSIGIEDRSYCRPMASS